MPLSAPPRLHSRLHPWILKSLAFARCALPFVFSATLGSIPASAQVPLPPRIMPLGDSITRGSNSINYPNGDIPGGYRRELGNLLAAAGYAYDFVGENSDNAAPNMDPDHNGNNGFRTDEVLAGLPAWLAVDPDAVLMCLGTNDILQRVPVQTAVANLDDLIELITTTDPDRELFVSTIVPITQAWPPQTLIYSKEILNADADAYNVQVRALVQQHANLGRNVFLVDMNALLDYEVPPASNYFFQPGDGVHPAQGGYDQMATIWFAALDSQSTIWAPPAGVPATPTGLTLMEASPSRINLSWADQATDETLYQVFQRAEGGDWVEIAELPADSTSHAAVGLATAAKQYSFGIRAVNANGASAWSNIALSSEPLDRAFEKPAEASSSYNANYSPPKANDGSSSTLWGSSNEASPPYWKVNLQAGHHIQKLEVVMRQDTDIEHHRKDFEIQASNDPNFGTFTVLGSQGTAPLPHKGSLTVEVNDPSVYQHIRVAKTVNTSFAIAQVHVQGAESVALPTAPDNLTATALDSSQVELTWSVLSDNESGFKLERKTGVGGIWAEVATPPAATSTTIDHGLSATTTYYYRLRASNESGDSAYTAEIPVTTGSTPAYDLWAADYPAFLALPPADREPSADPNSDGISNLLAYSFGLDPLQPVQPDELPRLESPASGGTAELIYQFRRNKLAPDLTIEVMGSDDLSAESWTMIPLTAATVTDVVGDPDVEDVALPVILGGMDRKFFRLRVVKDSLP